MRIQFISIEDGQIPLFSPPIILNQVNPKTNHKNALSFTKIEAKRIFLSRNIILYTYVHKYIHTKTADAMLFLVLINLSFS